MANDQKSNSDDTISLDDFILGSSRASVPDPAAVEDAPAAATDAKNPAIDQLDAVLAQEDPDFAESMSSLKRAGDGVAAAVDIDSIDLDAVIKDESASLPRRLFRRGKTFVWSSFGVVSSLVFRGESPLTRVKQFAGWSKVAARALLFGLRDLLVKIFKALKATISAFFALNLSSKLMVFAIVGLAIATYFVLKMSLQGKLAPKFEDRFITSFADVADERWTYLADEPMDDFNDPIFHPEHIVLFDKLVANLRPEEPGTNPMALFELYIEASNEQGAIELKDREVEARDLIGRTLEQMTYEELATAAGKAKLKVMVRKSLNEVLTKGRVRRVFYKNVVLKP